MGLLTNDDDTNGMIQDDGYFDIQEDFMRIIDDEKKLLKTNNNLFRISSAAGSVVLMGLYKNLSSRTMYIKAGMMAVSAFAAVQVNAYLKGKEYIDDERNDQQIIFPVTGAFYYLMSNRTSITGQSINYQTVYEAAAGIVSMYLIDMMFPQ